LLIFLSSRGVLDCLAGMIVAWRASGPGVVYANPAYGMGRVLAAVKAALLNGNGSTQCEYTHEHGCEGIAVGFSDAGRLVKRPTPIADRD
jgi:hypothetical protein